MKQVKFTLPIGTEFPSRGGVIRHIGNGDFIAEYDDLPRGLEGTVTPGAAFGIKLNAPNGQVFEAVPLTLIDDPHDEEPVLATARAPFVLVVHGRPIVDSDEIDAFIEGRHGQ